jgi:hypothetical protein
VRERGRLTAGDHATRCTSLFAALLQQFGDETRPSRLMTGADAAPGLAVEVLVERHVVAPVRILLKARDITEYRTSAIVVAKDEA